jgi:alanyl-tRNA synthetase
VSTRRLYDEDAYLLEFEARVVSRREHEGRPAVVLDQTAFYPESGGQPWDAGTLNGVPVVAVLERGDDVLHVLAAALVSDLVTGCVDAERRRDHREQHHGQHLLSRAFVEVAQAGTVSFHLGAEASSVDLDRDVSDQQLRAAESLTNQVVWSARPIGVRVVSQAAARALGVLPPPGAGDAVRLVEASGFDLQPCGGTHPRSTSEVGVVLLLGRERYKDGARIRFVCGHRALVAFRERCALADRLCALLSAPLERIGEAAERALADLAALQKRVRHLNRKRLEAEAQRLLAGARGEPAVVQARFDGWPAEDLRTLAQCLVEARPCVALLGGAGDKAYLVFAQSDGLAHDVPGLLREAVALVGGRGGGKGNLAQGGGDRLEGLDEALERAAAAVRRA